MLRLPPSSTLFPYTTLFRSDAVARRAIGEPVARKPPRVLELARLDPHLATGVGGDEADHELAREGPVLAPDVAEVRHVHADLLLHLAVDGALERLAVVHEARHEGVATGGPIALAGEQAAVAVADQDDDRRVQMRIVLVAAVPALLAPLALDPLGGRAAARAVSAGAFPV